MSNLRNFLILYDISCQRRLRRVYNLLRSYGDHLQLSVFNATLSPRQYLLVKRKLLKILKASEDSLLIFDLGLQLNNSPYVLQFGVTKEIPKVAGKSHVI